MFSTFCNCPSCFLSSFVSGLYISFLSCLILVLFVSVSGCCHGMDPPLISFHSCLLVLILPCPQSVLEEMCSKEPELGGLRERAHSLWEGQAAGKGFVHRVCQLAARYLALSNRTKVTYLTIRFGWRTREIKDWFPKLLKDLNIS